MVNKNVANKTYATIDSIIFSNASFSSSCLFVVLCCLLFVCVVVCLCCCLLFVCCLFVCLFVVLLWWWWWWWCLLRFSIIVVVAAWCGGYVMSYTSCPIDQGMCCCPALIPNRTDTGQGLAVVAGEPIDESNRHMIVPGLEVPTASTTLHHRPVAAATRTRAAAAAVSTLSQHPSPRAFLESGGEGAAAAAAAGSTGTRGGTGTGAGAETGTGGVALARGGGGGNRWSLFSMGRPRPPTPTPIPTPTTHPWSNTGAATAPPSAPLYPHDIHAPPSSVLTNASAIPWPSSSSYPYAGLPTSSNASGSGLSHRRQGLVGGGASVQGVVVAQAFNPGTVGDYLRRKRREEWLVGRREELVGG